MSKAPVFSAGPSAAPFTVTPHDSTNFTEECRYLYVGTTGNVVLVKRDNTTVTYVGVPAGGYIWANCIRVNSTSTTASNIIGHP